MKTTAHFLALLLALGGAAGSSHAAGSKNTASVVVDDDQTVATLRGTEAVANAQGDKIELAHQIVYVNGQSYGKVPDGVEIKYVVTKTTRTLFVDGKPRQPLSKEKVLKQ